MSFCELFICITLTERRNVVDDSMNDFCEWLRLSWVEKRTKNLLMFSFRSRIIIVKSYCVFCWIERFIACWDVANERICAVSMTWNRSFVDAAFSFDNVSKCMNDLLFQIVSSFYFFFVLTSHWKLHAECLLTQLTHFLCSLNVLHSKEECSHAQKSHFSFFRQNFVKLIILLTSKALFNSAFFFEIFVNSMRIIV
jgi:hypothetical protein